MRKNSNKNSGVDFRFGNRLIEVKKQPQAVSLLRDAILQLASMIGESPDHHAYLLLVEPRIGEERLRTEWRRSAMALRPQVFERLHLVVSHGEKLEGIDHEPTEEEEEVLQEALSELEWQSGHRLPAPDYHAEIFKVLLNQWIRRKGAMRINEIEKRVGCNYRTVANTINRLAICIHRHTNGSVELKYFPEEAWSRMVATMDRSRATIRYVDRSGQPRSPDSLLRRLEQLNRRDVAVGGVIGARYFYRELDLVGTPRVDLTVHCPETYVDLSFIEKLDPALAPTEDRTIVPSLVLHSLRRKENLFTEKSGDLPIADRVECLLDLHDARLEAQASDFADEIRRRGMNE